MTDLKTKLNAMTLYQRIDFAFNTLWYDSAIPDFGTPALQQSMDLIHPAADENDTKLIAKGYLINAMALTVFDPTRPKEKASLNEINAAVFLNA